MQGFKALKGTLSRSGSRTSVANARHSEGSRSSITVGPDCTDTGSTSSPVRKNKKNRASTRSQVSSSSSPCSADRAAAAAERLSTHLSQANEPKESWQSVNADASGHASPGYPASRRDQPAQQGTGVQQGTPNLLANVSEGGGLELGCVLKVIHNLLSNYEVKFTLQLLEGLCTLRPSKYAVNVSVTDFVHDLRCFTPAADDSPRNQQSEPVNILQSLISQLTSDRMQMQDHRGQSKPTSESDKESSPTAAMGRQTSPNPDQNPTPIVPMIESDKESSSTAAMGRQTYPNPDQNPTPIFPIIPPGSLAPGPEHRFEPVCPSGHPPEFGSEKVELGCHQPSAIIPHGFHSEHHSEQATSYPSENAGFGQVLNSVRPVPGNQPATLDPSESADIGPAGIASVLPVPGEKPAMFIPSSPGGRNSVPFKGNKKVPHQDNPDDVKQTRVSCSVIVDRHIDLDDVSIEQAEFLAAASDPLVVHPNNRLRVLLDVFVLVLIIVECVTLPLTLSFSIMLPDGFQFLSLSLFCMDLVMSFTTGYYHHDFLVMRRRRITRHYLRSWFILDFVSLFPWEPVMLYLTGNSSVAEGDDGGGGARTTVLRTLKLGKLLRVLRLLRLAKITALVKRLQNNGLLPANMNKLKFLQSVTKMFVVFGLLSHWSACFWGWLGLADNIGHDTAGNEAHDLATCTMGGPCEPGIEGSPWRHRYGLENYSPVTEYFAALQFTTALITGGEAPLQPSHPLERLFVITVMICSIFISSVVVGEILLIMNRTAEARMVFDEHMCQARDFMVARKVPTGLQVRVYRYVTTQHQIHHGNNNTSNRDFMVVLNDNLRGELVVHLNSAILLQHPFFQEIEEGIAVERLCMEATPMIFSGSEYVMEKGMPALTAHFLVTGKVRVENPIVEGDVYRYLYLQPPSWLGDICLFVNTLRKNTVTAVIMTETLSVNKSSIQSVCQDFPTVNAQFKDFQKRFTTSDALVCPICHAIGHCSDTCPQKSNVMLPNEVEGKKQHTHRHFW